MTDTYWLHCCSATTNRKRKHKLVAVSRPACTSWDPSEMMTLITFTWRGLCCVKTAVLCHVRDEVLCRGHIDYILLIKKTFLHVLIFMCVNQLSYNFIKRWRMICWSIVFVSYHDYFSLVASLWREWRFSSLWVKKKSRVCNNVIIFTLLVLTCGVNKFV